jgi:hypothetical protein
MPYSDYRPDLMGTARLEPAGAFEAGSWQEFVLTYTAGRFGIDDNGSIKIGFRFATDFGPVQFHDPKAPGYTTARASNGADLECRWEFRRNIRPWSRSLYVQVLRGFLAPGDRIEVRFGDRSGGSPGVRLQTYGESRFQFRVFADPIATYDYVALPESPAIRIVPGDGIHWFAILPTLVRAGSPFRLTLKIDDKWGNPSDRVERTVRLAADGPLHGLPERVRLEPGGFGAVVEGLTCSEPGEVELRVLDEAGELLCRANPLRAVPAETPLVQFWGDLHGQSEETLGTNSARDYFAFGRDRAALDAMGHQGNDFQITGSFWRALNALTAEFDRPGRFVCIPGYEWSANTAIGGDRNVHFRHEGETIHRSSHAQIASGADLADEAADAHDARELFARLAGRDCVVVPHVGGRYADLGFAHDPGLEPSVEVHSAWGTFEWLLEDAFAAGHRVGIVANSDGHKGRPGACYPGASFFGSYGGLTCFLAERLDRDALFAAMRRRRHYATTGNRPFLDLQVIARGMPVLSMGDIARVGADEVELLLEVVGTAPIECIELRDGPTPIETIRTYTADDLGDRVRLVYEGAECRGRGRNTVWDGSLRLSGNRIVRSAVVNNWNLDRGIQDRSDAGLSWKACTSGNYGAIDLWLAGSGGRLGFATPHVAGEAALADVGVEPLVFPAGGLSRAVRLQRLPDAPDTRRVIIRRTFRLPARGELRLYARVQQIDGHRIWTSPVYLGR